MSRIVQHIKEPICGCYLWEMALNVGLEVSFAIMLDWETIPEKAGEVTI
jgi:hypothetical protein